MRISIPRVARRLTPAAAAALACVGLGAGCSTDDLLEVDNPGIAQPSSLTGASGLAAYYAAAIGDFAVAFSGDPNGDYEGLVNYGGLLSDEIGSVDTFPTRNETDQRRTQLDNSSNADVFRSVQRARANAELAATQFASGAVEGSAADPRRAEALSIAGFSYVLMAEDYCSGIPFGGLGPDGATLQNGAPQSTDQVFQIALAKFDTALTIATTARVDSLVSLARVGRGRALIGLNRTADAAAAVAAVPSSFGYNVTTSANTDRQNNGVYYYFNLNRRFSAINNEGTNGLPFLTAGDPRVLWQDSGRRGFDGTRKLLYQLKYPQRTSPIPLASGAEARLIQAEGALAAGAGTSFVGFLNAARTAAGVAAQVADPGTQTARENLLFRERAFGLWLTGHRLGDMRRLVRFYGRAANTVFPVGEYSGGGTYSTDVNLPIPVQELNNPNYSGVCNKAAP